MCKNCDRMDRMAIDRIGPLLLAMVAAQDIDVMTAADRLKAEMLSGLPETGDPALDLFAQQQIVEWVDAARNTIVANMHRLQQLTNRIMPTVPDTAEGL